MKGNIYIIYITLFTVSLISEFAEQVSSVQTTGGHGNLLATKAVTRTFSVQYCVSLGNRFQLATVNNLQQPLANLSGNAGMCLTGLQANVFSMSYCDDLTTFVMLTLDSAYLTKPPAQLWPNNKEEENK